MGELVSSLTGLELQKLKISSKCDYREAAEKRKATWTLNGTLEDISCSVSY